MNKKINKRLVLQAISVLFFTTLVTIILYTLYPSPSLAFSIHLRLLASAIALHAYFYWKDWRVLPLSLMFFLMASRQVITLLILGEHIENTETAKLLSELPGFFVTILAFVSIIYLWKIFSLQQEKSQLEVKLRQAHKMEAIGTMAGGIAHNFNNILGAIFGYAELVKNELPEKSTAREDIEQVIASAQRARNLVQHIMMMSRQDTSSMKCFKPHQVIHEVIQTVKRNIPNNIRVVEELEFSEETRMDLDQFKEMLHHLCSNAQYAMRISGGTLAIGLHQVQVGEKNLLGEPEIAPGPFIQVSVSDSGSGIPPENLGQIFDPFFTTRDVGDGIGIGLSIVHGIVRKNGGFIKVESQINKGSTFKVFLPSPACPTSM